MNGTYWSVDEVLYNLEDLDEVISELLYNSTPEEVVGAEVSYGEAKSYSTEWVDADYVIDEIGERAYDEASEWGLDFPNVSKEARDELQAFLSKWQEEHCVATFYKVANVKKYVVTKEDVEKYLKDND